MVVGGSTFALAAYCFQLATQHSVSVVAYKSRIALVIERDD